MILVSTGGRYLPDYVPRFIVHHFICIMEQSSETLADRIASGEVIWWAIEGNYFLVEVAIWGRVNHSWQQIVCDGICACLYVAGVGRGKWQGATNPIHYNSITIPLHSHYATHYVVSIAPARSLDGGFEIQSIGLFSPAWATCNGCGLFCGHAASHP